MRRDDINQAREISYDERDVQCGREYRLFGARAGDFPARDAHLFYTVKRYGDPMIHVPGSGYTRTACGWSVFERDEVDVVEGRFPTCVRCAAAAFKQARK